MRTRVILLTMVLWLAAGSAWAGDVFTEEMAGFTLALLPSAKTDSNGYWALTIEPQSVRHPRGSSGSVRIRVGPGAKIIEGKAAQVISLSSTLNLKLQRTGFGPVQVRGSLEIPGPSGSYDYCEAELDLNFIGDSIVICDNRIAQTIAVRGGKRFRYGGEYLVAIEDDEHESPRQFLSRAEPISSPDIPCWDCGISDTVMVPLVVTVGKRGNVTWVRPGSPDGVSVDPRVRSAASEGIKRWRFRAAKSPSGPIADYAVLHVRVRPSREPRVYKSR